MARLALLLTSILVLACNQQKLKVFNRSDVSIKTSKGICYVNEKPFTGILVDVSSEGDTLSFESYLDGKAEGTWRTFYDDGRKKEIRYFHEGKKEGDYFAWWPDGTQRLHYRFKADEYEGELSEWEPSGQLIKKASYVAGHEEGRQQAWYSNGKVRSNYVIIHGRRYGLLGTKNCMNVADSVFNH